MATQRAGKSAHPTRQRPSLLDAFLAALYKFDGPRKRPAPATKTRTATIATNEPHISAHCEVEPKAHPQGQVKNVSTQMTAW
jgi:hypothetical protein